MSRCVLTSRHGRFPGRWQEPGPRGEKSMSFTLALPRLSLSGESAVCDAVAMLEQQGVRSALVLTDKIVREFDGGKLLFSTLEKHHISFNTFDAIDPNPTTQTDSQNFVGFYRTP